MTKRKRSGKRARQRATPSGKVPRPAGRWTLRLVLACVAVGLGVAAFLIARPYWRSGTTSASSAEEPGNQDRVGQAKPQAKAPARQEPEPNARADAPPEESLPAATPQDDSPKPADPTPPTIEALCQEQLEVARRLAKDLPNSFDAMGLLGMVHNVLGDYTQAAECWQKCLKLDPRRADAYDSLAVVAWRKGESEKAIALWQKALEVDPGVPSIYEHFAGALLGQGRIDEVIAVLEKEIALFPKIPSAHFMLGQAYLQSKDYEKAKTHYLASIEIYPDSAQPYFGLSTVCARLGQKDEAKKYREKFKELKADFWRFDAAARGRPVDPDRASMCRVVAKTCSDAAGIYQAKGFLWRAEKLWQRAATLDADDTASREALVTLYQHSGRNREALQWCQQLKELDPDNASYWMSIGLLHVLLAQFEEAEQAFKRVVELAPERSSGYQALALLYLKTAEKLPEAKSHASKAVELDPSAPNYAALSQACERTGDLVGALSAMEHAVELEGANTEYRQRYELLQQRK